MAFKWHGIIVLTSLVICLINVWQIDAHGRLVEPVHRGGAWRKGFDTPIDYNDNANYCGGFFVQYRQNHGKCGTCGDDYSLPQPRNNENGGRYGTGTIVKTYRRGQQFELQVEITANHIGYFEFSLCPLNSTLELETEECFDAYPIYLANGTRRHPVPAGVVGIFNIPAVLPANLTCEHCVLRWNYHCGNNWGLCGDGTGRLGCGEQEIFRTCSDVSIL